MANNGLAQLAQLHRANQRRWHNSAPLDLGVRETHRPFPRPDRLWPPAPLAQPSRPLRQRTVLCSWPSQRSDPHAALGCPAYYGTLHFQGCLSKGPNPWIWQYAGHFPKRTLRLRGVLRVPFGCPTKLLRLGLRFLCWRQLRNIQYGLFWDCAGKRTFDALSSRLARPQGEDQGTDLQYVPKAPLATQPSLPLRPKDPDPRQALAPMQTPDCWHLAIWLLPAHLHQE